MISLHNRAALSKKRKRVGRGGSRGGTSGRGHQGQGSRSGGNVGVAFEGGQMPLTRRIPKRGFNNASFQKSYELVNLAYLELAFQDGQEVTRAVLVEKGAIKGQKGTLLKILGKGTLTKKITVQADAFSATAREAIEKVGGAVVIRER